MESSSFVSGDSLRLEQAAGMRLLTVVLASQQPLTLLQLAEMASLPRWQVALDLIDQAPGIFLVNHYNKKLYSQYLGPDGLKKIQEGKLADEVLGSPQDQMRAACGLSTVTVAHEIVFDWFDFLFKAPSHLLF